MAVATDNVGATTSTAAQRDDRQHRGLRPGAGGDQPDRVRRHHHRAPAPTFRSLSTAATTPQVHRYQYPGSLDPGIGHPRHARLPNGETLRFGKVTRPDQLDAQGAHLPGDATATRPPRAASAPSFRSRRTSRWNKVYWIAVQRLHPRLGHARHERQRAVRHAAALGQQQPRPGRPGVRPVHHADRPARSGCRRASSDELRRPARSNAVSVKLRRVPDPVRPLGRLRVQVQAEHERQRLPAGVDGRRADRQPHRAASATTPATTTTRSSGTTTGPQRR